MENQSLRMLLKSLSGHLFKNHKQRNWSKTGKHILLICLFSCGFSLFATPQKVEDKLLYGNQSEKLSAIGYCAYAKLESCYYQLIELMKDSDNVIRAESAHAIGMIGIQESIPHLAKYLENEKDELVIKRIISAFGLLRNKKGADIVLPYITHKSTSIRMATARALIEIQKPETLEKINEAITTEKDELIKTSLIHASLKINRRNSEHVVALARSLFDTRKHVRYQAAVTARDLKLKELLKSLSSAIKLEKDAWVKGALEKAYYKTLYD